MAAEKRAQQKPAEPFEGLRRLFVLMIGCGLLAAFTLFSALFVTDAVTRIASILVALVILTFAVWVINLSGTDKSVRK